MYTKTNIIVCLSVLFFAAACTPISKLTYVKNKGDAAVKNQYYNDRSEKTIQPYDYLYIKIYSLDEQTNYVFRDDRYSSYETELVSYAVDDKGNIDFPFIGSINVKDLTINQAKERIEQALNRQLNNVSVRVRFVSNKITILGEVTHPGDYSFYDEKINIFQAVGLANGITAYGNKTNITLIREKDDIIKYYYVDLTDKKIVESENYYLLPNDIIIVNPIGAKYRELRTYSLSLASAIASTLLSVALIFVYTTGK
jgi:polysaccharide export outer membrane protein